MGSCFRPGSPVEARVRSVYTGVRDGHLYHWQDTTWAQ